MRQPKLNDVFLLSRIVRKTKLKEAEIDFTKSQEEVGGQLLFCLLENLDLAEDEIYELFSRLLEIKVEEIKEMNLVELIEKMKSVQGLSDFFTSLQGLTKQNSMTSC